MYPLSLLACYVAPGRHRQVHWDAAKRVLRYLCSTSGMGLVLGGWGPVVLTGHADASWVDDSATQRSSLGYTFSLGSGSVSWRSTRSSLVLNSSCEAEIYAGAMAAQELRWLTYLLTDLGEQPRLPPVLNAVLQDAGVDTFTPGRQRVAICTCSQTGRHLATFARAPGSSLYTLTTASRSSPLSPQLHASAQHALPRPGFWSPHVSASPPSLACAALHSLRRGRQRAAPHSSFPQTEAPLQTLHLDVWGPSRVRGQGHERYFLLVVDDYTRYTTVFPLQRKADVPDVLIP
ncbi:unnamed protein product [Closterium sp. NIES-54]